MNQQLTDLESVAFEGVPRGGVVEAALQDLGAEVAGRAADLAQPAARHDLLAEAEVGQLDVQVRVQQDVLGLDVPVVGQ